MQVLFVGNGNNLATYSRHAHPHFEIVFVTSGSADSFYGEESYTVRRGHLALLPPDTYHRIENGDLYSDLYVATDEIELLGDAPLVLLDDSGLMETMMRTLYTVWMQKEENYQNICDRLLAVVIEFVRKLHKSKSRYEFVDRLKNSLVLHLSDANFDFKKEAAALGMHPDYLRHCFKAETGSTPLEYLMQLRIAQAKRFLSSDSGYTVSEIAYLCGFSDPYYFSRCFKKQVGKSPKAYRTEKNVFR